MEVSAESWRSLPPNVCQRMVTSGVYYLPRVVGEAEEVQYEELLRGTGASDGELCLLSGVPIV